MPLFGSANDLITLSIPAPEARAVERRDSNTANPAGLFSAAWDILTNTHTTVSGEPINETLALKHLSVYACVRTIAEDVGSLTFRLYKRLPKGRQEAVQQPLWRVFAVEPNNEMSASTVWEQIAGCMALTGNAYLEILRNTFGDAVGLYPLDPRMTEPVRLPNGDLAFRTRVGVTNGQTRIVAAKDMLHFPLFSFDGLKGLSPIGQARNDLGLAIAATKHGAKFFGNSSAPGGLLIPPDEAEDAEVNNMRSHWEQANSAENSGRVSVVGSGWTYKQISLSPEQSQFLETREMSRQDVAALFRMPPSKIGDVTKASKASAEQENLTYVTDCLRPYLVRIEREIQRKLLPDDLFVEADVSERLRGDFASTMAGFAVGKQWGFFSTNYILEKLGENPVGPEGDILWAPVNMQNAARLLDTESVQDQPIDAEAQPTTETQRSLFAAYVPAFSRLFTDAVGRATSRSKRDAEALTPIFAPVLESISALVLDEARAQLSLPEEWNPADKAIRDVIKSAATRAKDWTADQKTQIASTELNKAIRSLHFSIYREAGAAIALQNPPKLGNTEDED